MGLISKSFFILLVAISTPLIYRQYANDGTVKFMSQYYSNYKVVDQFLRQSADHLNQAKQYLPDSQQIKSTYEQVNKQLDAFITASTNKLTEQFKKATPAAATEEKPNQSAKENGQANHRFSSCPGDKEQIRMWSREELSGYDGKSGGNNILLGFLGTVYNVTLNEQHYGPGADYNVLTGRDATRAFVTGNFTHDLTDDLSGIDENSYSHIETWVSFYSSSYQVAGRVEGAFFDSQGCATPELARIYSVFDRLAKEKTQQRAQEKHYPECNSEWNTELNKGRVWCSTKSGGVERDWVGSPRLLKDGDSQRCVCFNTASGEQSEKVLELYPGCDPNATECTPV